MKKNKIVIISLITLLIGAIGIFFYLMNQEPEKKSNGKVKPPIQYIPKLKIIDENSNTRPIAIMINNNQAAWKNHSGIQDAYLVYEIITEGGITRMLALYKDQTTERIGSVRSSRHYFLDYALENDAIYAHFGWSPQAQSDIKTLGINNINGLYDGNAYFRDRTLGVAYEHTAYTSIDRLNASIEKNGYRKTTDKGTLLNYSALNIDISSLEGSLIAHNVIIPYSNSHTTSYTYDPETKTYKRFMNTIPHTDGITKKQYTTKNIIIVKVGNYSIDSYGRQDINNLGTGTGYYITNGYAVPITWQKDTRSSQTKYYHLNGKEITVNDGNTFIQIEPEAKTPSFSA